MDRFYIAPSEFDPVNLKLTGPEAHHCLSVMRYKVDDTIVVFNGRGHEIMAQIESTTKQEARLKILNQIKTPTLPYQITLGQAIPKGKNMDLIIQKATELGASRIIPILSERTVVSLSDDKSDSKWEKWQHTIVEAAKQSGVNWLPQLDKPVEMKHFFNTPVDCELLLIASLQPDAKHFKQVLGDFRDEKGRTPASVLILIGPEGDFTPAEISKAKGAGCHPITLGPTVLRTETASLYSLSIIAHELQTAPVSRHP